MAAKILLIVCVILAVVSSLIGISESFENTGALWIALTWLGGFSAATTFKI